MNNGDTQRRIAGFDSMRIILAVMGILLHGSLAYISFRRGVPWPVAAPAVLRSQFFDLWAWFLHLFRVPGFFVLAGFFAQATFNAHGLKYFMRHRLISIGLPFLLLCIAPAIFSFIFAIFAHRADFFIHHLGTFLNTDSMWFLYYLFIYYIVAFALLASKIKCHIKASTLITILIVLSAGSYYLMDSWFVPTDLTIIPSLSLLIYYSCFFMAGWILRQHKHTFFHLLRHGWCLILVGVLSFVVSALAFHSYAHLNRANYWIPALSGSVVTWSMIVGLMSLCFRMLNHSNKIARYLSDSTYWIYLSQVFPIILLQLYFAQTHLGVMLQYTLVCSASFLFSLLTYQIFVRHTWVGRMLRGGKVLRPS